MNNKKEYTKPVVEKITFSYEEHVIATSTHYGMLYAQSEGGNCTSQDPYAPNPNN